MSRLKSENLKQCVSQLREFIEGARIAGERKETALLALNQLQNITAGTNQNGAFSSCDIGLKPVITIEP